MIRNSLLILIGCLFLCFTAFAQNFNEIFKIIASDRDSTDRFGYSVSLDSNYAIIGAIGADEDTSGGNIKLWSGSAYIFETDSTGFWHQVQKIVASDRDAGDYFGFDVSISGNYAIIGAPNEDHSVFGGIYKSKSGSVYIFEKDNNGVWKQVQKITAPDRDTDDQFGKSIDIDGTYAIVGAYHEDHDTSGGNYKYESGSVYIFERDTIGKWNFKQKIVASDRGAGDHFGRAVSLSGAYTIIGAWWDDKDTSGGNILTNAGSAYIFKRDTLGTWRQVQKLVSSDRETYDLFGFAVSIKDSFAIIGAYREEDDTSGGNSMLLAGSVYIFKRDVLNVWHEEQKIVASDRAIDDWFGWAVSISGQYALVGAHLEDEDTSGVNKLYSAGSSYLFRRDSFGVWHEIQKIVASDRANSDWFGFDVDIDGDYGIIASLFEDEDHLGGNTLKEAGSSYLFTFCSHTTASVSITGCSEVKSPSGKHIWYISGTYLDTIPNTVWCDSVITFNLTINSSFVTVNDTACVAYKSPSGKYVWDSSGIYFDTVQNVLGCDSVLTINLTIKPVNIGVIQNVDTLISQATNATYQWVDCNNNYIHINGATGKVFQPNFSGTYAVIVTQDGCVDTSACYPVIVVSVVENEFVTTPSVYPNPTSDALLIYLGTIYDNVKISIYNEAGHHFSNTAFNHNDPLEIELPKAPGIYFISIIANEKKFTFRVVRL